MFDDEYDWINQDPYPRKSRRELTVVWLCLTAAVVLLFVTGMILD